MMAVFMQLKHTAFRITVTERCMRMVCLIFMCIRISYFCLQETQWHAIFSCHDYYIYQLHLMSGTDLEVQNFILILILLSLPAAPWLLADYYSAEIWLHLAMLSVLFFLH